MKIFILMAHVEWESDTPISAFFNLAKANEALAEAKINGAIRPGWTRPSHFDLYSLVEMDVQ